MKKNPFIPQIILLFIAQALVMLGALFKVQHWPYAEKILTGGLILSAITIVWFVIKMFTTYRQSKQ